MQLVFCAALEPHAGAAPAMKHIWPRVEPTVVPPRRMDAMQRTKRCVQADACIHRHRLLTVALRQRLVCAARCGRYHLAKQAYRLAVDS